MYYENRLDEKNKQIFIQNPSSHVYVASIRIRSYGAADRPFRRLRMHLVDYIESRAYSNILWFVAKTPRTGSMHRIFVLSGRFRNEISTVCGWSWIETPIDSDYDDWLCWENETWNDSFYEYVR